MIKRNYLVLLILFCFALMYALISIVNHFCIRTCALDLGMFNQALYNFSIGNNAIYTLDLSGNNSPFLSTHFSPLIILFSPLRYIFGSSTLLIIQILFVLFGSIGVYKLALQHYKMDRNHVLILMIHFLSIWGISSALSFDFHMNVIGSTLIPWYVYYLKSNIKLSFLFLFLILSSIETFGIFLFFIILVYIIKDRLFQFNKNYLVYLQLIICFVYVVLIVLYIMPNIQQSATNLQFNRYDLIGHSPTEMIQFIFSEPVQFFKIFFGNPIESTYDGIKLETILMILFSGGISLIYRPVFLIALLPILAIKFLSKDYVLWGINNQYSIELVPILSFMVIDLVVRLPKRKIVFIWLLLFTTVFGTFLTMHTRKSKWYNELNNNIFTSEHYNSQFQYSKLHFLFKKIDENEIVSSISNFIPHLAFRQKIYHFPVVNDATTIILTKKEGFSYPLTQDEYNNEIKKLKSDSTFRIAYSDKTLIIFKRKKGNESDSEVKHK